MELIKKLEDNKTQQALVSDGSVELSQDPRRRVASLDPADRVAAWIPRHPLYPILPRKHSTWSIEPFGSQRSI